VTETGQDNGRDPRVVFAGEALLIEKHESARGGRTAKFVLDTEPAAHPFADYDSETRFYAVFVRIDEDEHPAEETEIVRTERKFERATARGGRHSKFAGILCRDRMFQIYLVRAGWLQPHWRPQTRREMSAQFVVDKCEIASRAELDEKPEAFDKFRSIEADFYRWMKEQKKVDSSATKAHNSDIV
jgi:hypothetical protein